MSTSSPLATRPRVRTARRLPNWVYGVGLALLVVGFLLLVVVMFGRIGGEEFSPHDFRRRAFHYYQIPVARVQVWPVKRFDRTGDLELHLAKQKLIPLTKPKAPRWDLVRGYRGAAPIADGDALILARYLDQRSESYSLTWLDWTTENPKLAKIFWPYVAQLAQEELYFFLPDLFELAQRAKEVDTFQKQLTALLGQKYHDFGVAQHKSGHPDRAVTLLRAAVRLSPDKTTWVTALRAAEEEATRSVR